MVFIDEKVENEMIDSFCRIFKVEKGSVEFSSGEGTDENKLTLKTHIELKDEAVDVDITFAMLDKNRASVIGEIISTKNSNPIRINQSYSGPAQYLPKAMERLLGKYKLKRGFFKGYLS